jgi:hypothetical protein
MLIQRDLPQIETKGGGLDRIAERLVVEEMAPVVCLVVMKGGFPKCPDCELEIISVFSTPLIRINHEQQFSLTLIASRDQYITLLNFMTSLRCNT